MKEADLRLIEWYFQDDQADRPKSAQLEKLLGSDPEAAELFGRMAMLESALHAWGERTVDKPRTTRRKPGRARRSRSAIRRRKTLWPWLVGAAAAAIIISVAAALIIPDTPPPASTAMAVLQQVEGTVAVRTRDQKSLPVRAGMDLVSGAEIRTGKESGRAVIVYPDGTRLDLVKGTHLTLVDKDGSKRVKLDAGELYANVTRQTKGKEMILATPHAKVTVLGTKLKVAATEIATQVTVERGQVSVTKGSDSVKLKDGQSTLAARDVPLEIRSPTDAIVHRSDFETSTDNWPVTPQGVTVERLSGQGSVPGSKTCLQISGKVAPGQWIMRSETLPVALERGHLYRLSMWLRLDKANPVTGGPYLSCRLYDSMENKGKYYVRTNSYMMDRIGEWQHLSMEFPVLDDIKTISFSLARHSPVATELKAYIDDVELREIRTLTQRPPYRWDFERDRGNWAPKWWHLNSSYEVVKLERNIGTGAGQDSKYSLHISGTSSFGSTTYVDGGNRPLTSGRRYRLSADLKVVRLSPGSPAPTLKVEFDAYNVTGIKPDRVDTEPYDMDRKGEWQRLSVEFTPPESTLYGWPALQKNTRNAAEIDAHLDNVTIELLDEGPE